MQSLDLPVSNIEERSDSGLSSAEKEVNHFYRLWQRFRNQIIQDVPENYTACEFECSKPHCTIANGEKCEIRLLSRA